MCLGGMIGRRPAKAESGGPLNLWILEVRKDNDIRPMKHDRTAAPTQSGSK